MISRLSLLLFCGIILAHLGDAQKLPKVKKLNMKAHINITGDTLIMKFHRPNENIKLEGFILGYGSNYFTNQYIQWPDNGKSYITDVDAETRYLIAVKPNDNHKKSCKDKNSVQKPLQLVVGTLTPTSVFLSWGILINPQVDWSALNKCPNDRFYTVRYREKNKDWHFQLCPTTETVIDNLKPNTIYEFGVKDNSEDEIWSKPQTHKTSPKGKENGNIENNYKIPKGTLQYASEDTKAFVPVTKVKQGYQNLSKSTPPPNGKSQVYRDEIKKPYVATTTTRIATPKPKPVSKITESLPVSKPSEKPDVDDPKPVASQPIAESFTPDLSTGTLEWVRATMVTHPFFQVTNIPIESSATDEHTASLVVRESDGTQDESAGIATLEPVLTVDPPRDILVSPTIAPFQFPKELPSLQPETVLEDERLPNYVPNEMTVSQIVSGREQPVSTDAPQSSVHTSPEQQNTILDVDPVATDIPQERSLLPLKKNLTTLAADEKQPISAPTNIPILEKLQTHYVTTRQSIPTRQTTLPFHTRTKSTAFTSGQHIHTTYESIARTDVPPSVSAIATQNLPAKQRTWPPHTQRNTIMGGPHIHTTYEAKTTQIIPAKQRTVPSHTQAKTTAATASHALSARQSTLPTHIHTKTTTALTGGPHIHATYESIARTEVPHSVSAKTTQIIPAKQRTLPSHTQPKSTTAFTESQHIQTAFKSITSTEVPPSVSATASQVFSTRQSTLPTHIHTKTTTGGPHIHTTYESIARTEVPHSVSAKTTQSIPAKQRTVPSHTKQKTTTATASQIFSARQSTLPSHIHTKTTMAKATQIIPAKQRTLPSHTQPKTTMAFTESHHIQTVFKSISSTEVPPSVSATAIQVVSTRHSTLPSHIHTKTTTAFTGGPHIHTTYESIARTEVPHSVSAKTTQIIPAKQRTLPSHTKPKTTTAFTESQHIQTAFKSFTSTGVPPSVSATASQVFSARQSSLPTHLHTKTVTAFTGSRHTSATKGNVVKTEASYSIPVPNETASFHPKPFPSTEAPNGEADSTQPDSEIKTTEAPHTYETFTLASHDKTVVQKFSSTSKPKTTTVRKTTSRPLTTNAPTTSQWTESTQASKKTRVSPVQHKTPLPEKTHPTAVLKDINPTQFIEETTTALVSTETQKLISKKTQTSESPSLPVEPNKTEQDSSPKFNRTTESPTTSTVVKPVHSKRMPINLIALQIFADPTVPSEIQTSPPPIPKTTQSNKKLYSKPAPKSTQRVPINFISLQIFEEPDVPLVPNTQRPYQSTTTQKPESPHSEPVPTQKVSTPITKKPKPTPRTRAKPASTGAPMDTTKPKRPHVIATTLAPYRLQHSSTRPRPRTRLPALNGATQGPIRSRPTGEFNWLPGTIPGGKVYDSTKLLGVSRNISMEPNNTGKRTFLVSSPPLPPVRPTSIRRRIQQSNVTGRPGVSVSSPPLLPVRPTSIRRKPSATNVTGRPGNQGGILIPRAPSTATPECAFACIKSPMKQPTLPSQEEDLVYSTVFSPSPKSDIDALGKPRYTAPHVVYMSKNESVPCSITDTLKHFSTEEESTNQEITSAPQNPPTNLTVVTVEGCSSFVVLNWEKPDNDSVTEYNVISKENGGVPGKDQSIITTNLTHSTVENLKPDTSYEFQVIPKNPLGEGPSSTTVEFNTESADPRVSEPVTGGKDAIWTEIKFKADSYSDCKGKQFVKRTWYKKFVGIQLCNSLRYKIYLSDTLAGTFYNIGDQSGFGEDHCQFVDSFLEGRTGEQLQPNELIPKKGFYRSVRQQPVEFGDIGGQTHISYVHWYECGISIPGKW